MKGVIPGVNVKGKTPTSNAMVLCKIQFLIIMWAIIQTFMVLFRAGQRFFSSIAALLGDLEWEAESTTVTQLVVGSTRTASVVAGPTMQNRFAALELEHD